MLELLIAVLTVLVLVYIKRRRTHMEYFKRLNIPGPEPSLFSGNIWEYYNEEYFKAFRNWHQRFGSVVGVFIGYEPWLIVADVELLKNVFIKDFTDFTDRALIHGTVRSAKSLLSAKGSEWKSIRQIATPSFTSSKLKALASQMHVVVNELIANLQSRTNQEVDMKKFLQALTLDVICRSALGANYSVQKDIDNNKLFQSSKELFGKHLDIPHIFGLIIGFHESIMNLLRSWTHRRASASFQDPVKNLFNECAQIIKARRATGTSSADLLQLLMNASANLSEGFDAAELTAGDENIEQLQAKKAKEGTAKLSDDQIVQNAFAVLVAGFETTASTLTYLINILIHFPDVQERLLEEIQANIQKDEDMHNFDKIQKLAYMDGVVKETLRLFPPVGPFSSRVANADKVYGNIPIPKGLCVVASIEELHYNNEFWSNPTNFDPLRFARGEPKEQIAWQPFGIGPRNCIGMRFAQMEIKIALGEMIRHFRFERCAESPDFPPCREQVGVLARLKGPLMCRVIPRAR